MNRSVCIHAHFYQPPRENPWLEAIELQDSAHPYHDWNERITSECYRANSAARILEAGNGIVGIVNNYSRISFNFGPTLLSWLARSDPDVYEAILEADRQSLERFSGHGSAIAQAYNHMIMPLANARDRRTQVLWGIADFEHRFKRKPEGMWLPETAVDYGTLEALAEQGLRFTILSPHQAAAIRRLGDPDWIDVSEGRIDGRRAYLCPLPSGRSIGLFFYDGPVSQELAFTDLLGSGAAFAQRLLGLFKDTDDPQIVSIATDGETYGHHHRHGEMALAFCLRQIEDLGDARITVYGQHLAEHPPEWEVQINSDSSWSCIHGVERWKSSCGCNSGMAPGWGQEWRGPLRGALDWLRDGLAPIYERGMAPLIEDPWSARDRYIQVVLDRSAKTLGRFLSDQGAPGIEAGEKVKALGLLEMQRHAMLMYTSCGWFFDEISGIETVQVLQYAARAIQLARQAGGIDLMPGFLKILERAPSNLEEYGDGAGVFRKTVEPAVLDLTRVGAHFAISSLFEEYRPKVDIFSYTVMSEDLQTDSLGRQKLVTGQARVRSRITFEELDVQFGVLHLGDHNIIGGIRHSEPGGSFEEDSKEMAETFRRSDIPGVIDWINRLFPETGYSLRDLFRDEQRKVMGDIVASTVLEIEGIYRRMYENHYPFMKALREMGMPVPRAFAADMEVILNTDARILLQSREPDFEALKGITGEADLWSVDLDRDLLGLLAGRRGTDLLSSLQESPEDPVLLARVSKSVGSLLGSGLPVDLWDMQNIFFRLREGHYSAMAGKAARGDQVSRRWLEHFRDLGRHLDVKVPR